jgi:tRNA threonylcarbamoyladenosine biosynthesis protein TsaB
LILALDTATLTLSAALVGRDGRAVASRAVRAKSHSLLLPGVLVEMLDEAGLKLADLDALAVGVGPGSFTGLRVGMATMRALAFAAEKPLLGASSLQAMAQAASRSLPPGTLVAPLLDARKGEVYAGLYRTGLPPEPALEERVLPPAALAEALRSAGALLFGEGLAAYAGAFAGLKAAPDLHATPPAEEVARLCLPRLGVFDKAAVLALQPNYLRPSEAELNRARNESHHGHG